MVASPTTIIETSTGGETAVGTIIETIVETTNTDDQDDKRQDINADPILVIVTSISVFITLTLIVVIILMRQKSKNERRSYKNSMVVSQSSAASSPLSSVGGKNDFDFNDSITTDLGGKIKSNSNVPLSKKVSNSYNYRGEGVETNNTDTGGAIATDAINYPKDKRDDYDQGRKNKSNNINDYKVEIDGDIDPRGHDHGEQFGQNLQEQAILENDVVMDDIVHHMETQGGT